MQELRGTTTIAATILVFLALGLGVVALAPSPPTAVEDELLHLQARQALAQSPITFEQNLGQADPRAQYISRVNGSTVFLTPDSMVVRMPGHRTPQTLSLMDKARLEPEPEIPPATVRMSLVGSNPAAPADGSDEQARKTHYYRGDDPDKWTRNVPHFGKVRYDEVYPGIDLVYYSRDRQIEYDFVVEPGADPSVIRFQLDGVDDTRIDHEGNLLASTPRGEIKQAKPYIYQEENSGKTQVDGSFRRAGDDTFTFELASYDPGLPLVIDPMVDVSLMFGGGGTDRNFAIAVDANDNFFVGGHTDSVTFLDQPTNGDFDAFFVALAQVPMAASSPEGAAGEGEAEVTNYEIVDTLVFGGDKDESLEHIAVDPDGMIYFVGTTASSDFPQNSPEFQADFGGGDTDGFIGTVAFNPIPSSLLREKKLAPDVEPRLSYFGGAGNDGLNRALFHVREDVRYLVLGGAAGSSLPGTSSNPYNGGDNDIVVAKLRLDAFGYPSADDLFRRYYGRNGIEGLSDMFYDTDNRTLYLAGGSQDTSERFKALLGGLTYQLSGPTYEGFTRVWDTGSNQAFPFGIFCKDDYVYVGIASDVPRLLDDDGAVTENPGRSSLFVGIWDKAFERLYRIRVHGGSQNDFGAALIRGLDWVYYICGQTSSNDIPQVNSIQPERAGGIDMFVIKCWIDMKQGMPDPKVLFSTYYGGSDDDAAFKGAIENWGNLVMVGWSGSSFPTLFGPSFGGGASDGFLVRFKMPHVPVNGIVAPGSFRPGPVSPGKIISIFGHWVGAKTDLGVSFSFDADGRFPKKLAETECIFVDESGKEHRGAMLFSSHRQTNCVVPYSLPEGETWFYVVYKGIKSNPVDLVVQKTCPDILNLGGGQAAVVNLDNGTINGPNTPASPGSFVSIFMTGGGCPRNEIEVCDPVPTTPGVFFELESEVVVTVGDTAVAGLVAEKASSPGEAAAQASVLFAGLAPGFTPGLVQINAQLAEDCPTGQVPLNVAIGGVDSAPGIFMYVAE